MIVPAILTDKRDNLIKMIDICSEFTDYVQIDIMDGEFVPSKSIEQGDLKGLHPSLNSEAHLMVKEPMKWIETFREFGSQRIIFHFESSDSHRRIIDAVKNYGLQVGIAVNPSTPLKDFEYLCEYVDVILFMSVNPGFYGSAFIPAVLDKIKMFKSKYQKPLAGIDGGVKLDNLRKIVESGVDYICVGSAILKDKNPKEAFLKFKKWVKV
jgi:ribulose-phosphate 3-epimerase